MKKYLIGKLTGLEYQQGYFITELTPSLVKYVEKAIKQLEESVFVSAYAVPKTVEFKVIPQSINRDSLYSVVIDRIEFKFTEAINRELLVFEFDELFDLTFPEELLIGEAIESSNKLEFGNSYIDIYFQKDYMRIDLAELKFCFKELNDSNQLELNFNGDPTS